MARSARFLIAKENGDEFLEDKMRRVRTSLIFVLKQRTGSDRGNGDISVSCQCSECNIVSWCSHDASVHSMEVVQGAGAAVSS